MLEFAIACSEKFKEEEAIKEISLRIKSFLPKSIGLTLIFFTAHYKSSVVQHMVNITLRPEKIVGIHTPYLIYENKILERGVAVLCFSSGNIRVEANFINTDEPEKVEVALRQSMRRLKVFKFMMGFIAPSMNPYNYSKGLKLGLGRASKILTMGFLSREVIHSQILDRRVDDGILYIGVGAGVEVTPIEIGKFLPLGEPFTFTKVDSERNVILEINNLPAAEIYKKYLDDKFELFWKKQLFSLYPLGVRRKDRYRLLNITEILEDYSLSYLGKVREGEEGNLMMINPQILEESTENVLGKVKEEIKPQLVVVANSLIRKDILRDKSAEEIYFIKEILGENIKMIGLYSDYHIVFDNDLKEFVVEKGNLYLLSWG